MRVQSPMLLLHRLERPFSNEQHVYLDSKSRIVGKTVSIDLYTKATDCLFVLRFYGPVNPMGSCRARSVYLTTRLLDRLSPLSG